MILDGNIYLTGFMGAGKSSAGRILARFLGRKLVELDDLAERRLGMTIAQAFERLGEDAFRKAECDELAALADKQRLVVSTGGGVPVNPANRKVMRASGKTVLLETGLDTCAARVRGLGIEERPLWQDRSKLEAIYQERMPAYADHDLAVNTDEADAEHVAREILAGLMPELGFNTSLEGKEAPVVATCQGPEALRAITGSGRVALLCDHNLKKLHLERYREMLGDVLVLSVAPGERSKSLTTAKRLYEKLMAERFGRDDLLIALGGGMTTDLGAFAAATFKRGMRFALVSTSLLGCVDAAVGGKAGVNLGRAKNAVGCFTQPEMVVLDLLALSTLKKAQRAEGLVEAYKTGLALKPGLARMIEDNLEAVLAGDLFLLARAASESARAKAEVVAQDFREGGLRKVLNLGHTYGHAVEGLSNFKVSHGASVALGIMAAAEISNARGLLPEADLERILGAMAPLAPVRKYWPEAGAAWNIMLNDKKNRGGKVLFVLLEKVGVFRFVEDVDQKELGDALELLKERCHV